jgi:hypothetical protein
VKVLLVMAVIVVAAGLGVHWARDQATAAIHHAVDTALPTKVEAHPWTPVRHGRPLRSARVSFAGGTLTTGRCKAALGSYSVRIDHHFSFARSATPVRPGCPGSRLAAGLRHAVRVDVATNGPPSTP